MNINDILATGASTVGVINVDTNIKKTIAVNEIAQDFFFASLSQDDDDTVTCFLETGYSLVTNDDGRYTSEKAGVTNPVAPIIPSDAAVNESSINDLADVYALNAATGEALLYDAPSNTWSPGIAGGPAGPQGDPGPAGADGEGFTGGSYDESTGIVTFTSDDGLGFSTTDLRGADGVDGAPGVDDVGIGTSSPTVSLEIDDTDAVKIPVGTEAQRPGTPSAGMLRFNDDADQFEGYDGTEWGSIGGSGGGGDTITYNGASAWGNASSEGTLLGGLNIASVTRSATGTYDVVFATPMPDANYSVVATPRTTSIPANWRAQIGNQTATGFTVYTVRMDYSNGATVLLNAYFSFAVHSQNALPPAGTTGIDCWGSYYSSNETLYDSYNVGSITKAGVGDFTVNFATPMPTANYAVVTACSAGTNVHIRVRSKTVNGFRVTVGNNGEDFNYYVDTIVDFQVTATNANLPYTFTKEQIEAAINNTGAYAWGSVAGTDGSLIAGNNCTTSKAGTGTYSVVFNTPLPDANYSVVAESGYSNSIITTCTISGKTASGFSVFTNDKDDTSTSSDFDFTVTAAKGQLLSLGGGADAWASAASDGTLQQGHNIASVTRTGTGTYDVVFTTPMPTDTYSAQSTLAELSTISTTKIGNRTVNGFTVNTGYKGNSSTSWVPFDTAFTIAVFATDGNAGGFWSRTSDGVQRI